MCDIIGYAGLWEVEPILLSGLRRLELVFPKESGLGIQGDRVASGCI